MAGDAICLAAIPIAFMRAGLAGTVFAMVMASVAIGTVLGAALGGPWAEKITPKYILIITDISRGLAQLAAAALLTYGVSELWLVGVYFLFGIGIGASRPSAHIVLISLIPKKALPSANSSITFLDNIIAVVFPATIGVLFILANPVWGLIFDGVTFFGAAILISTLHCQKKQSYNDDSSSASMITGFLAIIKNPTLRSGLIATIIINVLCFPVFLVIGPYAIAGRFDDTLWGLCLAASGLGACVGSIVSALLNTQYYTMRLASCCGIALALAMYSLAIADHMYLIIAGAVLFGLVEGVWLTSWATVMQIESPTHLLGRIVGIETLLTSGLHPLIYLGSGLAGAVLGYQTTLIATGTIALASILFLILLSKISIGKHSI
jgi:predicted MFS family arabinose efflux permease